MGKWRGANTESFASLEDLYQCKLRREASEVKSSLPFVTNECIKSFLLTTLLPCYLQKAYCASHRAALRPPSKEDLPQECCQPRTSSHSTFGVHPGLYRKSTLSTGSSTQWRQKGQVLGPGRFCPSQALFLDTSPLELITGPVDTLSGKHCSLFFFF